jgi:uncharacterized protein involved in oxidation of intracellular sulfur
MGKALVILNEPAYGSERAYNGLRLAVAMAKRAGMQVRVFLIGDAVACAKRGQRMPAGYYSLEAMLGTLLQNQGEVGICGSCLDARGIADADLAQGARRGSMEELATWTGEWADKVIVF